MKHFYTLLFFFFVMPGFVVGQNLVPNPSFEDKINCPHTDFTNMDDLEHWFSSGGSADFYNPCANDSFPERGIPNNMAGFQFPYHGIAHAGLFIYIDFLPLHREYMGVKLLQPLEIGKAYCVSAYISRSNLISVPIYPMDCAVDKFGFKFSTQRYEPYAGGNLPPVDDNPQVFSSDIIYDSINWVKVAGTFEADSTYEYLYLGNFFDHDSINTSPSCTAMAYYYVDLVSVSTDTIGCQITTSSPSPLQTKIQLYPNPASHSISIKNLTGSHSFSILTSTGYNIKKGSITEAENVLDVSALPNGLYFLRLDGRESFKFVVQK